MVCEWLSRSVGSHGSRERCGRAIGQRSPLVRLQHCQACPSQNRTVPRTHASATPDCLFSAPGLGLCNRLPSSRQIYTAAFLALSFPRYLIYTIYTNIFTCKSMFLHAIALIAKLLYGCEVNGITFCYTSRAIT